MTARQILFVLLLMLLSGCVASSQEGSPGTATSPLPTATLPATLISLPSGTPIPPTSQPTPIPVEGTTAAQLNVRAEPSTAGSILGILPANSKVQILGKDPAGHWLQILYPQGTDGTGWVTAQYVVAAQGAQIAVVGGSGLDPNDTHVAVVQQQINVRSGPGTGFNSLGTLKSQDVVRLTGKDANSAWLQIEFAAGPGGKGWVNAAFVQARGVENLPIIAESGEAIGTGTPTGIPPTRTPTVIPAWMDNDTQANPLASLVFDPLGTQTLIYSGDVSAPDGDSEDWLQFTSYTSSVVASLECSRNDNLQVRFLENGSPVSLELACGDMHKQLPIRAGSPYTIHLQAPQYSGGFQYIQYTITIQAGP